MSRWFFIWLELSHWSWSQSAPNHSKSWKHFQKYQWFWKFKITIPRLNCLKSNKLQSHSPSQYFQKLKTSPKYNWSCFLWYRCFPLGMLTYLYTELVPPNNSKFPSSYFLSVTLSLKMVTSGQQVFFLEITWCTYPNGCFCPLSIRYTHTHLQKTNKHVYWQELKL